MTDHFDCLRRINIKSTYDIKVIFERNAIEKIIENRKRDSCIYYKIEIRVIDFKLLGLYPLLFFFIMFVASLRPCHLLKCWTFSCNIIEKETKGRLYYRTNVIYIELFSNSIYRKYIPPAGTHVAAISHPLASTPP